MIIGINGNKNILKEVGAFLKEKYGFYFIDVDSIFDNEIKKFNIKGKSIIELQEILFEVKVKVNRKILELLSSLGKKQNVLITSSMQDLDFYKSCDLKIKVDDKHDFYSYDELISGISINEDKTDFHITIDMYNNWQDNLSDFIEYNLFHRAKVSVIVPVYNTEAYLLRCINSIRNQSYKNLEIILINDGSTDNSLKICEMFASIDNRIKVINQSNVGLAETRNRGIEVASCDFICFIDSDDFIESDMIETLLRNLENNNADVSQVRAYIHTRTKGIERFSNERKLEKFDGVAETLNGYANGAISIAAWDKLYRKSFLEKVRFDRSVFKEDVDFIFKLCLNGGKYVCDTKECYHYVKRDSNSITDKFSDKIFQLKEWSFNAYRKIIIEYGEDYRDVAEKCLFNGLTHILKTYKRDLDSKKINVGDYKSEIEQVASDIMNLLLNTDNVTKFDDLDNVLTVINDLIELKAIDKNNMPKLNLQCIGILWNSLNADLMKEAVERISEKAVITEILPIDLGSEYRSFINDIYFYNNEYEGIPYLKGCGLIDMFETNMITLISLNIDITGYLKDKHKGYIFKEALELKRMIRELFKRRIPIYAYDNIFHLTTDQDEYTYTLEVIKKYLEKKEVEDYGRK